MFFRVILFLLVSVILVSLASVVLRGVGKMLSGFLNPQPEPDQRARVPKGGTLVRDPVCGTYVSTEVSASKQLPNGKVVHFCSAACRDRYTPA